jgi:hypothetical protein
VVFESRDQGVLINPLAARRENTSYVSMICLSIDGISRDTKEFHIIDIATAEMVCAIRLGSWSSAHG